MRLLSTRPAPAALHIATWLVLCAVVTYGVWVGAFDRLPEAAQRYIEACKALWMVMVWVGIASQTNERLLQYVRNGLRHPLASWCIVGLTLGFSAFGGHLALQFRTVVFACSPATRVYRNGDYTKCDTPTSVSDRDQIKWRSPTGLERASTVGQLVRESSTTSSTIRLCEAPWTYHVSAADSTDDPECPATHRPVSFEVQFRTGYQEERRDEWKVMFAPIDEAMEIRLAVHSTWGDNCRGTEGSPPAGQPAEQALSVECESKNNASLVKTTVRTCERVNTSNQDEPRKRFDQLIRLNFVLPHRVRFDQNSCSPL